MLSYERYDECIKNIFYILMYILRFSSTHCLSILYAIVVYYVVLFSKWGCTSRKIESEYIIPFLIYCSKYTVIVLRDSWSLCVEEN